MSIQCLVNLWTVNWGTIALASYQPKESSIHPSIHYLYIICTPLNPLQGRGGAGAYPSWLRAKAGDTLDRSPVYHRAPKESFKRYYLLWFCIIMSKKTLDLCYISCWVEYWQVSNIYVCPPSCLWHIIHELNHIFPPVPVGSRSYRTKSPNNGGHLCRLLLQSVW